MRTPNDLRMNLEKRIMSFTRDVIDLSERLIQKNASLIISNQIAKSSISLVLNYGEAQNAESRKDFIHKLSIALKELRETHVGLKLIKDLKLHHRNTQLSKLLNENNELISIFVASINTARRNLQTTQK